jgi:hypothetical protein
VAVFDAVYRALVAATDVGGVAHPTSELVEQALQVSWVSTTLVLTNKVPGEVPRPSSASDGSRIVQPSTALLEQ